MAFKGRQYHGLADGIVKEAVYHHQVNRFDVNDDGTVLHLRRYKHYEQFETLAHNRIYFDFAQCRDLDILRQRYRAFDQNQPEPFLWHVFGSLAHAVLLMNEGDWHRFEQDQNDPTRPPINPIKLKDEVFLNHFDIKLENIFLGEPDTTPSTGSPSNTGFDVFAQYPKVLLADFGSAEILHPRNELLDHGDGPQLQDPLAPGFPNPQLYLGQTPPTVAEPTSWGRGTPGFFPPEQMRWGCHWPNPPNDQSFRFHNTSYDDAQRYVWDDADTGGIRFTKQSNIWAVGKILFDLVHLAHGDHYGELLEANLPPGGIEQEALYNRVGGHMIENLTPANPPYIKELLRLIERCMDIEQQKRPTVQDLVNEIKLNLGVWSVDAKAMSAADRQQTRLYFRGNEINNLPPGPNNFTHDTQEFYNLAVHDKYADPALPCLQLPAATFGAHKAGYETFRRQGFGKLPFLDRSANGALQYVPPQPDHPSHLPQVTRNNDDVLDINDKRVQAYRTKLEADVDVSLGLINAAGARMQRPLALMRLQQRLAALDAQYPVIDGRAADVQASARLVKMLKELFWRYTQILGDGHQALYTREQLAGYTDNIATDGLSGMSAPASGAKSGAGTGAISSKLNVSAEDRSIITTLLIFYQILPSASNAWISTLVNAADSELLVAHDPDAPGALRALNSVMETRVMAALASHGVSASTLTRAQVLESLIAYTERCIRDNTPSTSPNAPPISPIIQPPANQTASAPANQATLALAHQAALALARLAAPAPANQQALAPAAPPQEGDARGHGADGEPRYYCAHQCRAGNRCRHVCCVNGRKKA